MTENVMLIYLKYQFYFEELLYRISNGDSHQISIDLNGLEKTFFIGQSQTSAYGSHFSGMIGTKYENFAQDLPYIIPIR